MRIYIFSILLLLTSLPSVSQDKRQGDLVFETIGVQGLCIHCKQRIENAARMGGARSAVWDMKSKLLKVSADSTGALEAIRSRIAASGHDLDDRRGNDAAYAALPPCCHYRDEATQGTRNIMGVVYEARVDGEPRPLAGANITTIPERKVAQSNSAGIFVIPISDDEAVIAVSHAGFSTDTLNVSVGQHAEVFLHPANQMGEVILKTKRRSTYVSRLSPIRTQIMTERELLKAACCNLSETFETNPSVDVTYNDAVTGSKQIQLLGLSGNYTQLTVENLPGPRGLATPLGLNTISGPWIESIQVSKGVGSVVNGFEGIAGQINVELKKADAGERLLANVYMNDFGKTDLNLNLARKLGKNWSVVLLLHDDFMVNRKLDFNEDGFRDLPYGNQFSLVNRWDFRGSKGFSTEFGIKFLNDRRTGGETDYSPSKDRHTTRNYGLGISMDRLEGFAKMGYIFPGKKLSSIGLQLSAFRHRQQSYFGLTDYDANQDNFYANLIYQSIISTTAHRFRTGLSFVHDLYDERILGNGYNRKETVPGAFFEYTFSPFEKFTLVAGIRADHNSLHGFFATPRLHLRYEPVTGTTVRLSAGRGQRTANIFAENMNLLASSRQLQVLGGDPGKAYGLDPEIGWNKGVSVDQQFRLFNKTASLSVDFFRNDFSSQVVVDLEEAGTARFHNLGGRSYSNSLQAELNVEPAKGLEARLAYRLFDVKSTYAGELLQRPFISRHRAFLNLAYATAGWKFDYTLTINGSKRIPGTASNPVEHRRSTLSPAYVLMNAQVNKTVGKKRPMELYLGVENLTDYFQGNAIISPREPFSPYFDASLIWGPVSGRMFYAGWRLKLGD